VAKKWDKVIEMCRSMLLGLGANSPRYVDLHRDGPPSVSHLSLQDSVYRDKLQNPATVRGYLRDLDVLLKWSASISTPIPTLRDFDVAAFLRDQAGRGKSVPTRIFHSLVWFEKVFGLQLHTSSSLVRSQ
jgi:hypothetical protein